MTIRNSQWLAMDALITSSAPAAGEPAWSMAELSIPQLVAEVYEAAPSAERGRLLEHLLRPLGILSLFAVAGGAFAMARIRGGWPELKVRLEDIQNVRGEQVMALADHAQQVSVEAVDGLAQMLAASPLLSGSAAAALLVTLLVQRSRARGGEPGQRSVP